MFVIRTFLLSCKKRIFIQSETSKNQNLSGQVNMLGILNFPDFKECSI